MGPSRPRRAFSLADVVIAALVIGVSALPILEAMRSSTATIEMSEGEATARTLAADVLARVVGLSLAQDPLRGSGAKAIVGARVPADLMLASDRSLARGYPREALRPILERHHVMLRLDVQSPYLHPALGATKALDLFRVTVWWTEADSKEREMTLARLFARQ